MHSLLLETTPCGGELPCKGSELIIGKRSSPSSHLAIVIDSNAQRCSTSNLGAFVVKLPDQVRRPELAFTGRVLLPQTVLERTLSRNSEMNVLLFKVSSLRSQKTVAVGVESFTAAEGQIVIPNWVADYLEVKPLERVSLMCSGFTAAREVIFQPLTSDFNKLQNPRVILEKTLRDFPCLTLGTFIPIRFGKQTYELKVVRLDPGPMATIVQADVVTDFARPLDSFDHHWGQEEEDSRELHAEEQSNPFTGVAHTLK